MTRRTTDRPIGEFAPADLKICYMQLIDYKLYAVCPIYV